MAKVAAWITAQALVAVLLGDHEIVKAASHEAVRSGQQMAPAPAQRLALAGGDERHGVGSHGEGPGVGDSRRLGRRARRPLGRRTLP
ncbi:hypothetical protein J4032_27295 [Streptomyces formicae]|uniref:Secreted protein n=1 Tax=Streptomyces formicae TaxID=1616117 RepID=A0ABY3WPY0_9ACTN|nr:hypothetical protein [Streptomyces formicae]UNM14672.1 hypothetical protein J4032_27295 [Streptomyces formicae]